MKKTISFLVLFSTLFIPNASIASEDATSGGFSGLIPLIIMFAIFYWSLVKPLTKRKGKSQWLELLTLIPLVNMIYIIWLASLTDKSIIDKIKYLEEKLS